MGAGIALGVAGAPAGAVTEGPTVDGSASGALASGARLVLRIDAAEVGGWLGLRELDLSLLIGGQVVENVTYDVEDHKLAIGEQEVLVGTGGLVAGSYLRMSGAKVAVTTGGANLSLAATADVLRTIPSQARFRFAATDDRGLTASVTHPLQVPRDGGGGVSWGTVIATVCIALLGGAFLGNLFASSRRPPPRLSVYSSIQRRIDEERQAQSPAP